MKIKDLTPGKLEQNTNKAIQAHFKGGRTISINTVPTLITKYGQQRYLSVNVNGRAISLGEGTEISFR